MDRYPAGHSGFYLLKNGVDASRPRLLMANQVERSIDAQYYQVKNDITDHAFIAVPLQTSWWQRFKSGELQLFPIKAHL